MAAVVRVYTDGACTQQLSSLAGQYSAFLGPQIGLDGDSGEAWHGVLYLRNEGDQVALFVRATVGNDEYHYVSLSTDGSLYETTSFVEIPPGPNNDHSLGISMVTPLYVRLQIPPGTNAAEWNPHIIVTFKTLP